MNDSFRNNFPILKREVNGKTCVFLDGPAGTQVPSQVINAMSQYYETSNANLHGSFVTSQETDQLMADTRSLVADFLGAEGGHNISFGQNMTTLNYSLARAIGRYLEAGDEILITQLDHEANRGPWLSLQSEGITVKEVRVKKNGRLDYADFEKKVTDYTKLVCIGWSSNIVGTVNDIKLARQLAHDSGAWLLVDAVHYAPHFSIDVAKWGIDFLLCSAYKFYGPHVGLLYAKTGLLDLLPTDRLRTAYQHAPYSIETGTLNHAALAGVKAALEFIADQGSGAAPKQQLENALLKISQHEEALGKQLYKGLGENSDIKIIGPSFKKQRAPTISFLHKRFKADEVCRRIANENIFAWAGHFYALRASEVLGLVEKGGVTRMGISAYTNEEDVSRAIKAINNL